MMLLGIAIFSFCFWCVFSKHFCDGIVAKHFLSLSAIFAALVVCDPYSWQSLSASAVCLVVGLGYWYIRHHRLIHDRHRIMRHR